MILKFNFALVLILFLSFGCSNNPSSNDNSNGSFQITEINIAESDTILQTSAILVRFSDEVDIASFAAKRIIDSTQFYDDRSDSIISKRLDVVNVVESKNVTLNNKPQSLWYDVKGKCIALIQHTTISDPYGTIGGMNLLTENTLIVLADLRSKSGIKLAQNFEISFHTESKFALRVVPNPLYPTLSQEDPSIYFIHLPATCLINVFDAGKNVVFSHNKENETSGIFEWTLDDDISSGIYEFEILSDTVVFKQGVMVVNK